MNSFYIVFHKDVEYNIYKLNIIFRLRILIVMI